MKVNTRIAQSHRYGVTSQRRVDYPPPLPPPTTTHTTLSLFLNEEKRTKTEEADLCAPRPLHAIETGRDAERESERENERRARIKEKSEWFCARTDGQHETVQFAITTT